MSRARLMVVAVAGALAAVAWVLTRRTAPVGPESPPPPPDGGVREPRVSPPLAPAGSAFVDD